MSYVGKNVLNFIRNLATAHLLQFYAFRSQLLRPVQSNNKILADTVSNWVFAYASFKPLAKDETCNGILINLSSLDF